MTVHENFECAMCGQCCANQELVQITSYELYRLAEHFKISPVEFFQKYCELGATSKEPNIHLYIRTIDMKCPFLEDNKCTVHNARPYACRAYPMRAYSINAGEMKKFIREKYPMLEDKCNLSRISDDDELRGELNVLVDQAIAYWVDDAYFNVIFKGGTIDLSIPQSVTRFFLEDKEIREIATNYVKSPDDLKARFEAEIAYSMITMTLQSTIWGTTYAFVSPPSKMEISESDSMGKYLILTVDKRSYNMLRSLVEHGEMDLVRNFKVKSKSYPGRFLIIALRGSTKLNVALGFEFDIDDDTLAMATQNLKKPLFTFFIPDDGSTTQAVGFNLSIS